MGSIVLAASSRLKKMKGAATADWADAVTHFTLPPFILPSSVKEEPNWDLSHLTVSVTSLFDLRCKV